MLHRGSRDGHRADTAEIVWVTLDDDTAPTSDDPADGTDVHRPNRGRWLVALGCVTTLIVVTTFVIGGRDGDRDDDTGRIPTGVVERWSAMVDGSPVQALAVGEGVVVVAIGYRDHLVGLDASSGALRWRSDLRRKQVIGMRVVDGVALVHAQTIGQNEPVVSGIDIHTGDWRWSRALPPDQSVRLTNAGIRSVEPGSGPREATAVRWFDPTTGELATELTGNLTVTLTGVQRTTGTTVEVFDLDTHERVRQIDLSAAGIDGQAVVAPIGRRTVVAAGNELVLLDGDQRVASRLTLDRAPDPSGLVALVPVDHSDDHVTVLGSGGADLVSTDGDRLERVWSGAARPDAVMMSDAGPVVALTGSGGRTWELPPTAFVHVGTGRTAVAEPLDSRFGPPYRYRDGFLSIDAAGEGLRTMHARGFDGTSLWQRDVPPFADVHPLPDADAIVLSDIDIATGDTSLTFLAEPD